MFCRHLMLRTLTPPAALRLLGLETASLSPLSSLPNTYTSQSLYPGLHVRKGCFSLTPLTCLGSQALHTRNGSQLDVSSVHKQSKKCVPSYHISTQRSEGFIGLHTSSCDAYRKCTTKRHPLLGTQCTLNDVRQTTRSFTFSTKTILEASPPSFQPYLRLIRFDKPIGTMLLLWPCTWSIALAATPGYLPDARMLALFGAGAFFMRGAGCIINDMWDSDFDKKVERTKMRPLASGELTHFQALVFLASQLSISLGILLQLNTYSILLGAASMILVVLYPLAKRFTYWPQLMLGFTFNYGALLGWSAVQGACEWSVCLPLYGAGIMWTLIYDTIYAHQDKYDDMLIGVKSSALKLGDQTKPVLAVFSSIMIGCLTTTGIMCDQTWPYYLGVGLTAAHLSHQLYTVDLNNADDCAAKFRANSKLGLVLFLSIVAANLLRKEIPADGTTDRSETETN